ncbi:MAG TPA: replication endonuclease [Ideonella sp.]|uniref:replication endonuclease n=1 Tax=Ideonella sp. TaxID=1929293 RepID=UPI002E333B9F|nr:replication endonuclease [Ideonella sp.]HEX5684860.1 replication endonuclease [Ideonella sp.]
MRTPPTIPAHLPRLAARFDLSSEDLGNCAERCAARVQRLADLWSHAGTPPGQVMRTLRRTAKRHSVYMPQKDSAAECINRMSDPAWWRRALRKRFRAVELHAIQTGAVHRHASPYVSAKALRRHELNAARLAAQMDGLEAINQTTGEAVPMSDLIEASLANPANRRAALMARIKGIETSALAKSHVGLFLTITCPSRMHPRHSMSGAPNAAYDGTYPGRAHAYLSRVWSTATRRAAHLGLTAYGLRVVEPHHDACPHWHLLVFTPADQADAYADNLRAYALADSPNELGAQERRFTVKRIDPAKGSAVGYVAKYVSKSIDGEGVDFDSESDNDGRAAARRQIAWARTWGIRQFQFFGVPPITPTRELYRVSAAGLPGLALPELHQACKANDYAAWLATVEAHELRLGVDYAERESTRYRGETTKAISGLTVEGGDLTQPLSLVTRCDTWRIEPRAKGQAQAPSERAATGSDFSPWTRFNNSAPIDAKGLFPSDAPRAKTEKKGEEGETAVRGSVLHRAPLPGAGRGDWESARPAA